MATVLSAHALGSTEDFGITNIGGETASVLAFDKLTADQSVWLQPETEDTITQ